MHLNDRRVVDLNQHVVRYQARNVSVPKRTRQVRSQVRGFGDMVVDSGRFVDLQPTVNSGRVPEPAMDHRLSNDLITATLSRRFAVVVLGWLITATTGATATTAETVELVRDGQPRATILLEENPTISAQLAAHELQYHLQKMSGATLPIVREPATVKGTVVLVGESRASKARGYNNADFGQSEYLVKAQGDQLILLGRDYGLYWPLAGHRGKLNYHGDMHKELGYSEVWMNQPLGSCHAVHTFLERVLGVRWYLPTELGEVIPQRKTVTVANINLRRTVAAPYRRFYPWAINKKLYYDDWDATHWNRADHWDLRSGILYWVRNKHAGGPPIAANHSFNGWDRAFGEKHPEWFSPKDWEQMKTMRYQGEVNPCLSQEGVFRANLGIIRGYFNYQKAPFSQAHASAAQHPRDFFGICLNDNHHYCQCDACRSQYRLDFDIYNYGDVSHYFWNYTNRLARELQRTHPRARLIGLAYFSHYSAPKGLKFEPNLGVLITRQPYTHWDHGMRNYEHGQVRSYLEECGASDLFTWEYLLHPWVSSDPFPAVLPRLSAQDAKFLVRTPRFRGGIMQTQYAGIKDSGNVWAHPLLDHFRLYFRMKLYDDQTLDVETMLDEYYDKFYGPASGMVRKFIEALETRWCDTRIATAAGAHPASYNNNPRLWWEFLGTLDFITQIEGLLAQAHAAAPDGSVYAARVDLLDKGLLKLLQKNRQKYLDDQATQNSVKR